MEEIPSTTFVFEPQEQPGLVARHVTIVAPYQLIDGQLQELAITALALPKRVPTPPKSKGIAKIIRVLIEPEIRVKATGALVTRFDPPLTIKIEFTATDVLQAGCDRKTGRTSMSIYTYYLDENKVARWQKLPSKMVVAKDHGSSYVIARIKNLAPKDPACFGIP